MVLTLTVLQKNEPNRRIGQLCVCRMYSKCHMQGDDSILNIVRGPSIHQIWVFVYFAMISNWIPMKFTIKTNKPWTKHRPTWLCVWLGSMKNECGTIKTQISRRVKIILYTNVAIQFKNGGELIECLFCVLFAFCLVDWSNKPIDRSNQCYCHLLPILSLTLYPLSLNVYFQFLCVCVWLFHSAPRVKNKNNSIINCKNGRSGSQTSK